MVKNLFGSNRASRKEADNAYGERLPSGQHTVTNWPVLTYGQTPDVDPADWEFSITGLVERELTLDFQTFLAAGSVAVHADFHCVTSFSVMDNDWGGVPVRAILEKAQPLPEATAVMVHCYGGYTTNLLLDDLDRAENLFALRRNGEPLQREHGGPVRLMVPHLYAWKSAKWVNGFQFLPGDRPGFWEVNGYHMRGDPFEEERFS
jgi:DMSO/TMAO reductase YedYZ molybdopterin-dependent catalytic subunit